MRIGIDCRTILNPGKGEQAGVGHYTYSLVKNLLKADKKNEYLLFFDWRVTDTKEFQQRNVKIKYFPFSQYKRYLPFTYSHMLISAVLIKERLDIFHAPASTAPLAYPGDIVLTIHDLAIYRHPSWFPRGQAFSTKFLVPKSARKAKRIIAVSQATKRDIIRLFKINPSKIRVIYEGVVQHIGTKLVKRASKAQLQKKYKIGEKYLLFVGTLEPRKNLINLIKAFNSLLLKNYRKFKDYELIIAGGKGWKYEEIFKTIKQQKFGYKIRFLNYIPHEEKVVLMKNATCFVFPTMYEGFGLPVLEAMSLGTPVITSKVSSLPEIAGNAASLVNPNKMEEITAAFHKVLANKKLREKMSKAGLIQARQFNWSKTIKETIKLYREVYQTKLIRNKKSTPRKKDKKVRKKSASRGK
ncbi:MAG: hypothetical protein COT24_03300 [Candidatus Kerfeldbacteria bacterium CG08_land_8_20_14_0_20_40_16]|uniref:Glycosyltransferase family 1 protein n=1 Tax=Candidatus Kerfeldbacteria bacterium CG08_land_8_20_14_0_20_40_16 TaxID=2014244 RepID=A0A2H0YXL8_9BACT|nr:MAG: hypothetical protein COT24_03300 [Candidatus Kerfeldbacteria bacterium CG08_land_8_20_14_0_20_40_16]